jgi:hypothetical protein
MNLRFHVYVSEKRWPCAKKTLRQTFIIMDDFQKKPWVNFNKRI